MSFLGFSDLRSKGARSSASLEGSRLNRREIWAPCSLWSLPRLVRRRCVLLESSFRLGQDFRPNFLQSLLPLQPLLLYGCFEGQVPQSLPCSSFCDGLGLLLRSSPLNYVFSSLTSSSPRVARLPLISASRSSGSPPFSLLPHRIPPSSWFRHRGQSWDRSPLPGPSRCLRRLPGKYPRSLALARPGPPPTPLQRPLLLKLSPPKGA